MAEEKQRLEARRIERNRLVLALASVPFAAIPLLLLAALIFHPAFLAPIVHLGILGAFTTTFAWRRNPWPTKDRVDVEVTKDAIRVGREEIPRSALTRGIAVPHKGEIEVRLSKTGPDVELAMDDDADARRLLSALGFDAHQTVAVFSTMSRTQASMLRTVATVFGTMFAMGLLTATLAIALPSAAGLIPLVGMATLLTLLFAPTRVEVGADGISLRWLGSQRFVSHGDVQAVTTEITGFGRSRRICVVVTSSSGEKLYIPASGARMDDGRAAALAQRILDAREVYRAGGADEGALIVRGDRPHAKWVSELRSREVVGHRTAAVPKDRLWRVIEDAAAEPVERAAAAVALGKELADAERERLARAAKTSAVPKLRVVLENVADAEEEELAAQLAELEGKAKKQRRG
jgi:hypothetical protein